MAITSLGYNLSKQPIAQSFYIDEVNGIYATKIDLFFSEKDAALPVSIELRPMVNGLPSSSEVIPGSIVSKNQSTVNTSADATTATTFEFDEPLYLKGLTDYALVINADSVFYKIWVAEIDEFHIGGTERKVNKQPLSGSLFFSSNNVTFTPSQNLDLCMKLYSAKFSHSTGTVRLTNAALGRKKLSKDPLTMTAASSTVTVKNINSGLKVGQTIHVTGATAMGGILAASINGPRDIVATDWTGFTFAADSAAYSSAIGGGSDVEVSKNIPYSVLYPNLSFIQPKQTDLAATIKTTSGKSYAGTETAFQIADGFSPIRLNENNYSATAQLIGNDSAETDELSGAKSFQMNVNIATNDLTVSPMIDLQRTSITLVDNVIDKQDSSATTGFNVPLAFANETTKLGSSAAKHLTQIVELEEDAVGLKIILAANKPSASDFQVYYRTATSDETITDKSFSLIAPETSVASDDNPNVFREYRYLAGGIGGDLTAFTKFQVKIVFRSTNSAKVPRIRELRVIALGV